MENLILHVYYTCKPGMAQTFVNAVRDCGAQAKVHAEDGCFQYDYHLSLEKPDTVVLLERWRDGAALEKHMAQPHMGEINALKKQYVDEVKIERYE